MAYANPRLDIASGILPSRRLQPVLERTWFGGDELADWRFVEPRMVPCLRRGVPMTDQKMVPRRVPG